MPHRSVLALPQFLRFLSSHPSPNDVVHALVRGPLARYSATSGALWVAAGDRELRLIGSYGNTPASDVRYSTVPTHLRLPVVESFRDGALISASLADLPGRYPLLDLDEELWAAIRERHAQATLLDAPITSAGKAIGVVGLNLDVAFEPTPLDESFLTGVTAALGMWLSHPATPIPEPVWLASELAEPMALTQRQQDILQLVLADSSNGEIADALGYSRSTVKQELHRAMLSMRASNRLVAAERAWELGLIRAGDDAVSTERTPR